jgi:hypothetical protein
MQPDWSLWDGEGWIKDETRIRPRFSRFHLPNAKPIGENAPELDNGPPHGPHLALQAANDKDQE